MAGTTTYYGISYPTSTDYVKDGATAMQTIADGFDSAVAIPTYNNQTGTTYTFVLADAGKTVTSNNASAVTFTIPPQASVAWANNTTLTVRNLGAGVVTIAGGAGVTVTNTAQTVAQYGSVRIIRTASNAWTVVPASGTEAGLTLLSSTTFTTQSTINFTNVFSSTYTNYRLLMQLNASVNGTTIFARFRENTTDKTSSYQGGYSSITNSGVVSGGGFNNAAQFDFRLAESGTTNTTYISIDLIRPNATSGTFVGNYYNGTNAQHGSIGVANWSMTNFTGFSLYTGSATTITGNVRIFGYKEN